MLWNQFPQFGESFAVWLDRDTQMQEASCKAYLGHVNAFFDWGRQEYPFQMGEVTRNHVAEYFKRLSSLGKSRGTIRSAFFALRSFDRFLSSVLLGHVSFIDSKPPMRQGSKLPKILTREQMLELMQLPPMGTPEGVRDSALIAVLCYSGIRVSELCALSMNDVDLEGMTLKVRGKYGKVRLVCFSNHCRLLIQSWLLMRYAFQPKHYALFISYRGRRLSRSTVHEIVSKYGDDLDVPFRVSPHTLRHSFATELLDRTGNLRAVQELLGHASIHTTQRYTHLATSSIHEKHQQHHPRS